MKFTRKEFLKTGALITGGVLIQGHKFLYRAQEKVSGLKTIRDNIGIYIERGEPSAGMHQMMRLL
jgi:hypothetical protein